MSTLNQLISEIAHSVQQADSVPVRRAIRQGIIHARNELIRHSYSNHNYTDKVLKQRYNLDLIDVPDGDIKIPEELEEYNKIIRTKSKVPRPVRLTNNLPFHSVKTVGGINSVIIAHISESVGQFYKHLPGMNCIPFYDYNNEYIYIYGIEKGIKRIVVESVFEYPHELKLEFSDKKEDVIFNDDDEFFLPEDLVNGVKKLVLETFNMQVVRDTNEIPNANLLK